MRRWKLPNCWQVLVGKQEGRESLGPESTWGKQYAGARRVCGGGGGIAGGWRGEHAGVEGIMGGVRPSHGAESGGFSPRQEGGRV